MSDRSVPNFQERLRHAFAAKKLMLAKFKTSLVEGPAAIEKRQQRQAIAAARAERASLQLSPSARLAGVFFIAISARRCRFRRQPFD